MPGRSSGIKPAIGTMNGGVIIFWSDEDQAFVADVPELPGCMAHGDTHEATLGAVEEAIALRLETARSTGRAVPPVPGEQPPP